MDKIEKRMKRNKDAMYKKATNTTKVKEYLKDIKTHFKKDGWPLNYQVYKEMMEVKFDDDMHRLLYENGFTVQYDEKVGSALIKPKRKK